MHMNVSDDLYKIHLKSMQFSTKENIFRTSIIFSISISDEKVD